MPNSKSNQQIKSKKISLLKHGFKTEAERISDEYRGYVNLLPHEPLPCDLLTAYLKIHVKELNSVEGITSEILNNLLDSVSDAVSAITLYCKENNRFMIINNHTHSSARRESNIMHECAHIILNHEMEEFDSSNGFDLRKYNDIQEEEAYYLGFCLQLPKAALFKYYVKGKISKEEIAKEFNASIQAVNYRLRICGMESFKTNYSKKYNK